MDRTTAIVSRFIKADISIITEFVDEFGLTVTGIEYVAPARTETSSKT